MKVAVYVRDMEEARGLFLGHAEHTELDSVVEMFNANPSDAQTIDLSDNVWWPLYYGERDPGAYALVGVQFAGDPQQKNLIFEIVIGDPDT